MNQTPKGVIGRSALALLRLMRDIMKTFTIAIPIAQFIDGNRFPVALIGAGIGAFVLTVALDVGISYIEGRRT